jgi:hypothetical protein
MPGWNDLRMLCYDSGYSTMAVLLPFNKINWAFGKFCDKSQIWGCAFAHAHPQIWVSTGKDDLLVTPLLRRLGGVSSP